MTVKDNTIEESLKEMKDRCKMAKPHYEIGSYIPDKIAGQDMPKLIEALECAIHWLKEIRDDWCPHSNFRPTSDAGGWCSDCHSNIWKDENPAREALSCIEGILKVK